MGIFISYRRADSSYVVDRIYSFLSDRLSGLEIFRDVEAILPGTTFADSIAEALKKCRVMVVVIGPGWVGATGSDGKLRLHDPNDFVRTEIETAISRGIPVIPLMFDGAAVPSKTALPESLKRLPDFHGVRVDPEPEFESDLERLVAAIQRHVPQSEWSWKDRLRAVFLWLPLRNQYAKYARVFFYGCLVFAAVGMIDVVFPGSITSESLPEAEASTRRIENIWGCVVFLILAITFRAGAGAFERK